MTIKVLPENQAKQILQVLILIIYIYIYTVSCFYELLSSDSILHNWKCGSSKLILQIFRCTETNKIIFGLQKSVSSDRTALGVIYMSIRHKYAYYKSGYFLREEVSTTEILEFWVTEDDKEIDLPMECYQWTWENSGNASWNSVLNKLILNHDRLHYKYYIHWYEITRLPDSLKILIPEIYGHFPAINFIMFGIDGRKLTLLIQRRFFSIEIK
jgi:hypothetical protein